MSLATEKRERIRFLKFSIVGVTGAVVDFGILNLLSLVFKIPLVWSQGISFVCAVINNFLWNRYWTYPESRSADAKKQLIQFFIISIIGIGIRTPMVPWLNHVILGILEKNQLSLPIANNVISQNLALAISIIIILLWNYFANRYWTFKDVPIEAESKKTADIHPPSNH